jgi:hypothetical protein
VSSFTLLLPSQAFFPACRTTSLSDKYKIIRKSLTRVTGSPQVEHSILRAPMSQPDVLLKFVLPGRFSKSDPRYVWVEGVRCSLCIQ